MFGRKAAATGKPVAQPGEVCPRFKRDVSEVCHTCKFYLRSELSDEQGNKVGTSYECADVVANVLLANSIKTLINIERQLNGQGRAIEGFRNEIARMTETSTKVNVAAVTAALSHVEQQAAARAARAEFLPPVQAPVRQAT